MARILIVDDDANLRDMLALALEDAGYEVDTAHDGASGLSRARATPPVDIVVSDVNMPGLDGFGLCRALRASGFVTPIVLLTARDSELDEALGLEIGADDYVIKPFSNRVLLARVTALLRRDQMRATAPREDNPDLLRVGPLEVDEERLEVRYAGRTVETTVTEFRLVAAFATRPGMVYSRTQLLEKIRGDDASVLERIIDTYIRRIRRKFEALDPAFEDIETVVGMGYRWRDRA